MESIFALVVLCCGTTLLIGSEAATPYYGVEIGLLKNHAHDVEGKVFAVDDRTIFIKGLSYDGLGPDAYFWAGSTSKPDTSGFVIPDEKGKKTPLGEYRDKNVLLRLPSGKTLKNIKWISLWCKKFSANFGEVFIPSSLVVPRPAEIGELAGTRVVSSGPVTVVDTHTLLVTDLTFDGKGPAAHWWMSRGSRQHPRGTRLADENGSFEPLAPSRGKTVVISLPEGRSIFDADWFGLWSEETGQDLGSVPIPRDLLVPPSPIALGIELEYKLNCEVLRDDLGYEIRWIMDGEDIVVQLVGKIEPGEYMAFGLSKNDSHSQMAKADAIVAWMDKRGKGNAQDYYLATKEHCVGELGSCPDKKLPDGRDSVTLLNAAKVNGYTMVTFKRPQVGIDEKYDQHVYSDGPQAIIWAIGPLNEKNEVSYHSIKRSEGDVFLDFARSPQWNCPQPAEPEQHQQPPTSPPPTPKPKPAPKPTKRRSHQQYHGLRSSESQVESAWTVPPVACPADRTFRAKIGPSGGKKGFQAITGIVGWGLAYYINGVLLPEITVERGQNYTFIIEGGYDPENQARSHPLYITDDPEGGYEHKSAAEKKKVKVYAGVTELGRGKFMPTGRGRMCEYKLPQDMRSEDFESFEAFQENLELKCERGKPGKFIFRPDDSTPDLLYYQCYTHRHLGWKIHVVDSCDHLKPSASIQHATYNTLASDFKRGGEKPKRRYFQTTTSSTTTSTSATPTMEAFRLKDAVLSQGSPWWVDRLSTLKHQVVAVQQPPSAYQRSPERPPIPSARKPEVVSYNSQRSPIRTSERGPSKPLRDAERVPVNQQRGPPRTSERSPSHRGSASNVRAPVLVPSKPQKGAERSQTKQDMVPVLVRVAKEPVSRSSSNRNRERPPPKNVVPLVLKGSEGYSLEQLLSLLSAQPHSIPGVKIVHVKNDRQKRSPDHHEGHHKDHDHKDYDHKDHDHKDHDHKDHDHKKPSSAVAFMPSVLALMSLTVSLSFLKWAAL